MKKKTVDYLAILGFGAVVYLVIILLGFVGVIDEFYLHLLSMAGIYIIVALSLNLITGFTGQLALGHAGFMSIGAYTAAIFVMRISLPLFTSVLLGGLVAAFFGFLIGFPTLRLRGDYLAITTLGFGEIIRVVLNNMEDLTGGSAGLKGIPSFSDTGDFLFDALIKFTWIFGFFVATVVVIGNLVRSSPGRVIVSIREDEIASTSMGNDVARYKMIAFTVSAFFAGVGGGLFAALVRYLNPTDFNFLYSVNFVVIAVLGGLGSITGTILGGLTFTFTQEWLRVLGDFRMVVFGLMLILLMLFWQKGIMGNKELSITGMVRAMPAFFRGLPGRIRKLLRKGGDA
jgi:branched-chain amino acid transport system permease protein